MPRPRTRDLQKGFSLIQVSLLLAISAMVLAANLPGRDAGDYNQKVLDNIYKLDKIESAMQAYMASNGRRPCPADGQYDVNNQAFGWEAGHTTPNNPIPSCEGGSPVASMGPDSGTGNVYGGTVPTKTLGLPDDYAFDAWGRRYTYVVDKRATVNETCYKMGTTNTPGAINIQYKNTSGTIVETVSSMYAYISHGADGHGAWPPQGSTVAGRINRNSTDADTMQNAGVNASFTSNNTLFTANKVKRDRTATFDDLVYYHRDTRNTCCIGDACNLFNPGAFSMQGTNVNDKNGTTTTMIDINGDGIDDMVVAAPYAHPGGRVDAGAVYVTFGTRNIFTQPLPASSLNGTNGFVIEGETAGDHFGSALAVGDMNADGIQDLAMTAPAYNSGRGRTYVTFGNTGTWTSPMSAGALAGSTGVNGTNGIIADGVAANDLSGTSVAFGDVNNDRTSDLIVGAPAANTNAGATYIVFGGSTTWTGHTPVALSALAGNTGVLGTGGFRINGTALTTEASGSALTSCDMNGDGIPDIVIGAPAATVSTHTNAGRAYVLFGKSAGWTATTTVSVINGANGFYDNGVASNHKTGSALACGDLNGDGIPDLAIGAPFSNISGTENGSVYVQYGKNTAWSTSVDLSTLRYYDNGYRLDGGNGERAGSSLIIGPDLNGDGVQDLIIGAPKRAPGGRTDAGGAYIYFGKNAGMYSTNSLLAVDGITGAIIDGSLAGDLAGTNVSAGNINGLGTSAAIIGAPNVSVGGNTGAGKTYMIQGSTTKWKAVTIPLSSIP